MIHMSERKFDNISSTLCSIASIRSTIAGYFAVEWISMT